MMPSSRSPRLPGRPPPGVPVHYDYPRVPVTRLLDDAAQDFPESTGLDVAGHRLTYRQVLDQVDRLATVLSGLGVAPGGQVGTLLAATPQLLLTAFATWRLGAVVVLLDPNATPERLAADLGRQRCQVVVADDAAYPRLAALKGDVPAVQHVLGTGIEDYLPFPRNLVHPLLGRRDGSYARAPRAEGVARFKDAIRRTAPAVRQAPVSKDATAAVIDGARLGHHHIVAAAFALRLWVPDVQAGRETLLMATPPWRPFGLAALVGLGVLAAATITAPVLADPHRALHGVRRRDPTLMVVGGASAPLLDLAEQALPSLRVVLTDCPVDPERAGQLHAATGARLRGGLAGPAGLVAANPVYGQAELGSAGLPLPDTDIAVLDPGGSPRPTGAEGDIAVSGAAVPGDRWWRLGVTGRRDADGYVWLTPNGNSPGAGVAPTADSRDGAAGTG